MGIPTNLDFANEVKRDRLITLYRFTLGFCGVILLLLFTFSTMVASRSPEVFRLLFSILTLTGASFLTSFVIRWKRDDWAPIVYSMGWFLALTILLTTEDPTLAQLVPFVFPVIIFIIGLLLSPLAMLNWTIVAAALILGVQPLSQGTTISIDAFQAFAIFLTILSAILAAQATGELYQITEWALHNYQRERRTNDELFEKRQELQRSLLRSEALSDKLQETNVELQEAHATAEEAKNFRGQFLANMSHELRTPLNAIIGFSETMLKFPIMYDDKKLPDAYERDLSQIFTSGRQLLHVINDILDLAKVDAGKLEIHMQETEVVTIVQAVQSTARGLLKEKPVKLESILPDDLPTAWADETRLRQVLLNLYSNACKYTDDGSISLMVTVQGDFMQFAVKDTGEGIPEEFHDLLFKEFSQAQRSGRDQRAGTGLGLAISKQLVELMGGRIWMESEYGVGSTFYFTIQTYREQDKTSEERPDETDQIPLSQVQSAIESAPEAQASVNQGEQS